MVNEIPQTICRGVWACLESGKHVTLDRIQEATSFPHMAVLPYLNALLAEGYVKLSGITPAVGGETICLFELRRRTGPQAPYVNENGNLVDPNNIDLRPKRPSLRMPRSDGPSLPARLRVAAERLGVPFYVTELAQAAGITDAETRAFQQAFSDLRKRSPDEWTVLPDGRFRYQADRESDRERLRQFLKSNTGRWIPISEIREVMHGKRKYGPIVRAARGLLEAEGYTVEANGKRHDYCRYRVTPPRTTKQEASGE